MNEVPLHWKVRTHTVHTLGLQQEGKVFTELMTSDRKLKASRVGSN